MRTNVLLPFTFIFVVVASPMFAQAGSDRFCHQYAEIISDIARTAIAKNPACQDFGRGVHSNYQSHYNWCMRNSQDTVHGASDHIKNLAAQCTTNSNATGQGGGFLGQVWRVNSLGWTATWHRVGSSSNFKAVWNHPNGTVIHSNLTITMTGGNQVEVLRRDTSGSQAGRSCRLWGRMGGRSVQGQGTCDWGGGVVFNWNAQIN